MIYPLWYYIVLVGLGVLLIAWVAVGVKLYLFSKDDEHGRK